MRPQCAAGLSRASWAIRNQRPRRPAALRRWQCLKTGALWQLDATPHQWFPGDHKNYPLLDWLDDCSRVCTGAKIYYREDLLAISISFRQPLWNTACHWNFMWTATVFSSPNTLEPSLNSARPPLLWRFAALTAGPSKTIVFGDFTNVRGSQPGPSFEYGADAFPAVFFCAGLQ